MAEKENWSSRWPPETADRVVVLARLREDSHDRAKVLIGEGPPFDPGKLGFERHDVYLSSDQVVFLFEGPSAARRLADMIDDMVTSASFSAWAPLLKGTPTIAHEHFYWTASE
jgi:hypothetical protein